MQVSNTLWVCLSIYLAYLVIMLLVINYMYKKFAFLNNPKIRNNPDLPAFERKDYKDWNRFHMFIGAALLFPIRVVTLIGISVLLYIFFLIITLCFCTCDPLKIKSSVYMNLIHFLKRFLARMNLFIFGYYWINYKEIEPAPKDTLYFNNYGENKYSTVIMNHVHFVDGFFLSLLKNPVCFIANSKVKSMPVVGFLIKCCQSIFVDRSSKESKARALVMLKERVPKIKNNPGSKFCLS